MTAANSETCGNWERSWSITGDQDELRATVEAIHEQINACGWDETASFAVRLAMDEALSNALQHGNGGDAAQAIGLVVKVDGETVSLTVTDQGQGFELKSVPDPTADENLTIASGRGLALIHAFMSKVTIVPPGNCIEMQLDRADAQGLC